MIVAAQLLQFVMFFFFVIFQLQFDRSLYFLYVFFFLFLANPLFLIQLMKLVDLFFTALQKLQIFKIVTCLFLNEF